MEKIQDYKCFNCGYREYLPIFETNGNLVETECVECGARSIIEEEGKEEYQYCHKLKKENKNKENYSPRIYCDENIDEWESLAW